MQENSYFQKALADFTQEAASGGAIRHLADLGYTAEEIQRELAFPTPIPRIRRVVWEHLLDTGVVLREVPVTGAVREKVAYVREYDQYGKPSFRRVAASDQHVGNSTGQAGAAMETYETMQACGTMPGWKILEVPVQEAFPALLSRKIAENGEECAYASCDFGIIATKEPERFARMLQTLEGRQRAYVEGLPWEERRVYHRLVPRLAAGILRLQEAGLYGGELYFLKTGEKYSVYL